MAAVPLHHAGIFSRIDVRQYVRHGLVQAEADDVMGPLVRRNRKTEIAARSLERCHDHRSRIHEGAVPVENQQLEAPAHSVARKLRSGEGSGASTASRVSVAGCSNVKLAACRNMRLRPARASSLLSSKSPYFSSPAMGKPRCAR